MSQSPLPTHSRTILATLAGCTMIVSSNQVPFDYLTYQKLQRWEGTPKIILKTEAINFYLRWFLNEDPPPLNSTTTSKCLKVGP